MTNKKINTIFNLYSTESIVVELLEKMQSNKKGYKKLLELLQAIGDFDKQIEVFLHESKEDEKGFFTKLWFFDKQENIFIIYADSSKKEDLSIVEKQTESEVEIYDYSLAKNFDIDSENIDYLRFSQEYGFKFGRLISDQTTFYSLFLGDNIGFQIQIEYQDEKVIEIQKLLAQLNSLESKPNLQVFINLVDQILRNENIGIKSVIIKAFKDLKKVGEITIDESREIKISLKDEEKKKTEKPVESVPVQPAVSKKTVLPQPSSKKAKPTIIVQDSVPEEEEIAKKESHQIDTVEENKIYLDQTGYELFLQELEEAKQKLIDHQRTKNDAYSSSAGDGWHDNFAFEDAVRVENLLMGQLRSKQEMARRIVIIEKQIDNSGDIIDLNDIVSLTIETSDGTVHTDNYLLSGSSSFSERDERYMTISVNSPLGKSIYLKPVGSTVSYSVEKRNFTARIIGKIDPLNLEGEDTQKTKGLPK